MKKTIFTILIITTTLFANFYNLKPIKITKDIHCVIGAFAPPTKQNLGFVSNVCYVNMGKNIVVLDAGPTYNFAKELYGVIKKEYPKKKISYVILSNFHDDRVLGASFFKAQGVKIIGYKTIIKDMKKYKSKFDRIKKIIPKNVYANTKLVKPDILADNGYKVKGSKKTLIILKPSKISEESSDIAIYSKKDSFLFVGNMVFNNRMLNYRKESSVIGWIKALKKLAKLHAKYFFGGHGNIYGKYAYKTTLNYLEALKKGVEKAIKENIDDSELVKNINMKKFSHLKYFNKLNYNAIHNCYDQLQWQ